MTITITVITTVKYLCPFIVINDGRTFSSPAKGQFTNDSLAFASSKMYRLDDFCYSEQF